MSQTALARAYLADDAYLDRSREAAADADPIVIAGREYQVIAYTSTGTGFQGTAYRDTETGEVVIAARGTEFTRELLRDVFLADGGMVTKAINHQTSDALAFARSVIQQEKDWAESNGKPAPRFTAVGHSLGGAHAQIMAHQLGLPAETFNAYGAAELKGMEGPPAPGARVINHMGAADFVSAASPHVGEVRVYATDQDIAHLRAHGYGRPPLIPHQPLPPATAVMAGRVNALADIIAGPTPVTAALSAHGLDAHRMVNMAPQHGASLLTQENRRRYEQHRLLFDAYRNDIHEMRSGISDHAQQWPRAVDAMGWTVRRASDNTELATSTWKAVGQYQRHRAEQQLEANQQVRQGLSQVASVAVEAAGQHHLQQAKQQMEMNRQVRQGISQMSDYVGQKIRDVADVGRDVLERAAANPSLHQQAKIGIVPDARQEPSTSSEPSVPREASAGRLQSGDQGPEVARLQAGLIELGHHRQVSRPLQAHGVYDAATEQAVMAFQLKHGVEQVTGMADLSTQYALQHALWTQRQAQEQQRRADEDRAYKTEQDRAPQRWAAGEHDGREPFPMSAASILPFSDARHPEHALYADAKQRLEAQGHLFSDDRLNQITAQLHKFDFRPGWEGEITVVANNKVRALDYQNLGNGTARISLVEPAPPVQQTMQDVQQHDQDRQQQAMEWQQRQELARSHSGPVR